MSGRRHEIGEGGMPELFAELWHVPRFSGRRRSFRPQADCFRTDDPPALNVVVELPGADPSSVQVVAAGRTLVVAGDRARPQIPGARYQQLEIEYGPFQRRIQLAKDVDTERASARYENGMLRIVLPLAEKPPPEPRVTIEVRRP